MNCLVAINPNRKESIDYKYLGTVEFGPVQVILGAIELEQPVFDSEDSNNREYVLLRVKAFSCNYRDKSLLLANYDRIKTTDRLFVPFGSEFSAEIVAIGADVSDFQVGDRVMSDCSFPNSGVKGLLPGVATNFASLGWQRIHRKKLIKVPKTLSDMEAACFSLGSQTAAGMIRRSGILINRGSPLVFSARSATSLFIIQQLIAYGFKPFCLSTSHWSEAEMQRIYPANVEEMNNSNIFNDTNIYKITHVFDPFFDMNIGHAVNYLQTGGTYVTCGLRDQHPLLSTGTPNSAETIVRGALTQGISKNVSILGNCLGTKEDLENAIALHNKTGIAPIIDHEYKLNQSVDFVQRSFFDSSRFGKGVLIYEN